MPNYATDGLLPRDTAGFPAGSGYAPNVGTVALQTGTVATDSNNQPYAPLVVGGATSMTPLLTKVVDAAGTNQAGVDPVHFLYVTNGGSLTATVTAQTAGAAAIKTSAGRLCRIIVTSTATAALLFYDNATSASGTVIGAIPASAAIGTMYDVQMPFTNGIWPAGAVNTPSCTLGYS